MISKNGGNTDGINKEINDLIFNTPNIEIIRYTDEDLKNDDESDNED